MNNQVDANNPEKVTPQDPSQGKSETTDSTDKLTLKDAYKELWHCRDFELEHFWQRSIFLTAFLMACYTGYGFVLAKILDGDCSCPIVANLAGVAFSAIGMILSTLWIMMAKGSKAWYERYESAISNFFKIAGLSEEERVALMEKGVGNIIAFAYQYARDFRNYSAPVSNSLFNTKGGAYSPSKINILLGQLVFLIWVFIACIHFVMLYQRHITINMAIAVGIALMLIVVVFVTLGANVLKSRTLEEK